MWSMLTIHIHMMVGNLLSNLPSARKTCHKRNLDQIKKGLFYYIQHFKPNIVWDFFVAHQLQRCSAAVCLVLPLVAGRCTAAIPQINTVVDSFIPHCLASAAYSAKWKTKVASVLFPAYLCNIAQNFKRIITSPGCPVPIAANQRRSRYCKYLCLLHNHLTWVDPQVNTFLIADKSRMLADESRFFVQWESSNTIYNTIYLCWSD